jgi:hypothetical protein
MDEDQMAQKLPLDELWTTIARTRGLLPAEEKVDRAVQLPAKAIEDAVPGTVPRLRQVSDDLVARMLAAAAEEGALDGLRSS